MNGSQLEGASVAFWSKWVSWNLMLKTPGEPASDGLDDDTMLVPVGNGVGEGLVLGVP